MNELNDLIQQSFELSLSMEYPTVFLIIYNLPIEFNHDEFLLLFPSDVEIIQLDYRCLHHHFVIVGFNTIDDSIQSYNEVHEKVFCNRRLYVTFGYPCDPIMELNCISLITKGVKIC